MTLLVVDSSVVIKWFVREANLTAEAMIILDGYQKEQYTFVAPDFLSAEVGNIIWKKYTRQEISAEQAQKALTSFRKLKFQLTSTAVLLEDAYRLAVQYQRTVYDMLYVALSLRERCSFVTADEKLANILSGSIANLIWLGNWT